MGRVEELWPKDSGARGVDVRDPAGYSDAHLLCGRQTELQSCDFVAQSRCQTGG